MTVALNLRRHLDAFPRLSIDGHGHLYADLIIGSPRLPTGAPTHDRHRRQRPLDLAQRVTTASDPPSDIPIALTA